MREPKADQFTKEAMNIYASLTDAELQTVLTSSAQVADYCATTDDWIVRALRAGISAQARTALNQARAHLAGLREVLTREFDQAAALAQQEIARRQSTESTT